MKQENIWYQFYYSPLEKFWLAEKRTKEELYECIHLLQSSGNDRKKAFETVKKHLKTNNLQKWFLKAVIFILNLTYFYQKFLDIGMPHRRDMFNSERKLVEYYRQLSLIIAPDDHFWGRWLNLFEVRYDLNFDELKRIDRARQRKLFQDIEHKLATGFYDNYFHEQFTIIGDEDERRNSYLKKEINNLLEKIKIFNLFFELTFYVTYWNWLRLSFLYRKDVKNENRMEAEEKIQRMMEKTKLVQEKLDAISFSQTLFYQDYRMLRIYHLGSELIGKKTIHFRYFPEEEMKSHSDHEKKLLKLIKPESKDTLQYHIWFEYHRFLSIQRKMEMCLVKNKIGEGIKKLDKALGVLNKLEEIMQGGFSEMLIKVKYQKRGMIHVKLTLETMLLEKEIEHPFGVEYQINDQKQKNKDASFEDLQDWMKDIRKRFFGFASNSP